MSIYRRPNSPNVAGIEEATVTSMKASGTCPPPDVQKTDVTDVAAASSRVLGARRGVGNDVVGVHRLGDGRREMEDDGDGSDGVVDVMMLEDI